VFRIVSSLKLFAARGKDSCHVGCSAVNRVTYHGAIQRNMPGERQWSK